MKNKALKEPQSYSRLNLFIRSLILSFLMISTCVVYSFVCILAAPLPLRYRSPITRFWIGGMVTLCKTICHIDYHVEGLPYLKKVHPAIVMSKHQSAWETFYLASILDQAAIIAKRELLWMPFFGWALALLKPIAINRKNRKTAMQQINQQGQAYLDAGRPILIFPEGTRIPTGKVGNYKIGGARLSVVTGYPIIPVAHNAGRYWPRRQFTKIPGVVKVIFGPPIYPEGKTAEEVIALTQNWIEEKMAEIDR